MKLSLFGILLLSCVSFTHATAPNLKIMHASDYADHDINTLIGRSRIVSRSCISIYVGEDNDRAKYQRGFLCYYFGMSSIQNGDTMDKTILQMCKAASGQIQPENSPLKFSHAAGLGCFYQATHWIENKWMQNTRKTCLSKYYGAGKPKKGRGSSQKNAKAGYACFLNAISSLN